MGYLPIFIDVSGRTCIVIGGGEVAERKTRSLIEAGAIVVLISPQVTAGLSAMGRAGAIQRLARNYRPGDLAEAWLAFEATGDDGTARAVASEAGQRGVPVNIADVPGLCTFIAPAVVQRGGLQIAISTGGASPALAGRIRRELEDTFGHEYELMIDLLARTRQWLRKHQPDSGMRARILGALVQSDLLQCLKRGDFTAADAIVERTIGAGLTEIGFAMTPAVVPGNHDPAVSNGTPNQSR
jgi:precorrin-2 dehydrogenase / sirohydrochlorin ferrochelatase